MSRLQIMVLVFAAYVLAGAPAARAVTVEKAKKPEEDIIKQKLAAIDPVVKEAIRRGDCPGAVVVVGQNGKVVYRKAFGHRAVVPRELPMNVHTIFDMASVTKVVATTTAIMQLVEQGKIVLSAPVSEYWPEFKDNGKESIRVQELMTHYSGLPPDLELKPEWFGYGTAMKMIADTKLINPPGTRFLYSDINFETLGELVHRVSGQPLDVYCSDHIFKPLGMKDTRFKPPASWRKRIAPTQYQEGDRGKMLWGEVHDPTAYNMGGVAGHAGLFSSADDVSIFAQMLLDGGSYKHARILSPLTVEKMTSPETPPDKMAVRGLGWDLDSPFASNRGELFEVGSFGHTGFTGTSIWVDPVTKTYLIILSNRVHPNGKGDVVELRIQIATIVAGALGPISAEQVLASRRSLTGYYELMRGYREQGLRNGKVQTGIDVLEAQNFAPLEGRRVGLITNASGVDAVGHRTVDLLYHAPGVKLVALFSPEHGLASQADAKVASGTDAATGLPVYSLYGDVQRPTDKMLEGLDALVYDIQDAGVRFYTYTTTLGYCLEAARKGIDLYVLDRPDPINGEAVEGPVLDNDLRSFVAYFPEPVRPGMTVGELAQLFNGENHLAAKLHVIKMQGWQRTDWYDETGLTWLNPSPNLRNPTEEVLYPGVAVVEGANLSVGRGTDTPFEVLGAPWIDSRNLSTYLNERRIQGVRFLPADFRPSISSFAGQVCHGVQILLLDRQALDSSAMGVELAAALWKLYPNDFKLDKTLPLIGARWVLDAIKSGKDPHRIVFEWQDALQQFRALRTKYLLY
ncbi:MAG: serine hydrolase [Terriglobia bacterium]